MPQRCWFYAYSQSVSTRSLVYSNQEGRRILSSKSRLEKRRNRKQERTYLGYRISIKIIGDYKSYISIHINTSKIVLISHSIRHMSIKKIIIKFSGTAEKQANQTGLNLKNSICYYNKNYGRNGSLASCVCVFAIRCWICKSSITTQLR